MSKHAEFLEGYTRLRKMMEDDSENPEIRELTVKLLLMRKGRKKMIREPEKEES